MKRGLGKKGELTTQQLVTIIILIASFVIILFLLYRLNLGQTTDAQVCHNSVVLQGKTLTGSSLDCKTNYLCLSGGDQCSNIAQTTTANIDTSKSVAEIKNETFKAIADEMSNCWWEFGEGKIDYVSEGVFNKAACSICTIAAFGTKVQKALGNQVTYREFYNYLKTTPKTSSQTYLQYLYSTNTLDSFSKTPLVPGGQSYLDNVFNFSKTYFILTGEQKQGGADKFFTTASWNPFNTKFTPIPTVILEKTQQNYDAIGCDTFLTKA